MIVMTRKRLFPELMLARGAADVYTGLQSYAAKKSICFHISAPPFSDFASSFKRFLPFRVMVTPKSN